MPQISESEMALYIATMLDDAFLERMLEQVKRQLPPHVPAGVARGAVGAVDVRYDLLVYISGPMTANEAHTLDEHIEVGVKLYFELIAAGIPCISPHAIGRFPDAWSIPYDVWMAHACAVIDHCTHVLMMPGWETSRGATFERAYAIVTGKTLTTREELL
jgi:hypothetical protein